jgi:hypothetical protein
MRYFIVYNNDKLVFHYGTLTEKQFLTTGLENTFLTEDKQEFLDKLMNDFNTEYKKKIDEK